MKLSYGRVLELNAPLKHQGMHRPCYLNPWASEPITSKDILNGQ